MPCALNDDLVALRLPPDRRMPGAVKVVPAEAKCPPLAQLNLAMLQKQRKYTHCFIF